MAINAGTAIGYLDLDFSKFSNGFKTAQKELQGFTDKSNTLGDRMTSLGGTMKSVGSSMTKSLTLPLVGIGTASVATAAGFEKSMDKVAALSGATGKDLEDLTSIAKEMGSTTQFSASESADALGYMALAGWDTQQSMNALPGVLDLAAASGMGLAEASDMVTDYLSAFQEEADQAGRMADVLSYAQANSNTSTQQLGDAFKNCAVNANAFGLDIESTTALLGKLGDQGLKGSEAGTALNAVMRDMSSKMKDGAIAIGDTSVKITDANGDFLSMVDIVDGVAKATDGMSESERMAALQTTFTSDSIKAMGIFLNTGADDINKFTNELYGAEGASSDMADTMNDNLSGQLTQLKSALEGAAISIGEALMPMVKGLVSWINNLVNWFNNLDPAIQTSIVVIGGIVAAIGPVLLIIGQMVIAIGGLITFFGAGGVGAGLFAGAIAMITGPVGLAIAAIAALIAVGVWLYKNWDTIKAKASEIWNGISETIMNALNWLGEQLGFNTEEIFNIITSTWDSIKETLGLTIEVISQTISKAWDSIKEIIDMTVGRIFTIVSEAWNNIKDTLSMVGDAIQKLIDGDWEGAKEIIRNMNEKIKEIISMAWNKIKVALSQAGDAIKKIVKDSWNKVKQDISSAMNNIKQAVIDGWNKIKDSTKTACDNVKKIAKTIFDGIKNDISNAMSKAWSTAKSWWDKIAAIFKNPIKGVIEIFKKEKSLIPQVPNEDVSAYSNANDYSRTKFDYDYARSSVVSDNIAQLQLSKIFDNISIEAKDKTKENVNNESIINLSVNIDKMLNSDNRSIDDIANELAYHLKKRKIAIGGVR